MREHSTGNQELAPEELSALLGGELPSALPLEGWQQVTLHCQVDAIGPSEKHPDLVKLEVSFPPGQAPPAAQASLAGRPRQELRLFCGGCGLTPVEEHPQRPRVLRCVTCKQHLATGRLAEAT